MFRCFLALFVSACLLCLTALPAPADEENPAVRGAVEQGVTEGSDLLQAGKAAEAYELFSRLLREDPDNDAVNLGLARSAMAANRPNQALMAYLRLLEKYPDNAALHQEVAQVYMLLGDEVQAQMHLERDPGLTQAELDQSMDALGARYARLQVHGRVRMGMLYDSNANQGPAYDVMDLGNYHRVRVKDVKEKSSFGAYLGGQLDIGYRLEKVGSWWAVGDVQAYGRGNFNSDLEANTSRYWQWGRAAAGLRFLDSRNLLDMRLKAEIFDYEFDQHILAAGPEVLYVRAVRPYFQLITRANIDRRDYMSDRGRNGPYWSVGEYARFFFGAKNHEFMAGGRWYGGVADNDNYSYNAWEASASFTFKLPYRFEVTPMISYAEEYYDGPATVLENKDRKDDRLVLGLGVNYRLSDNWTIEAGYQYTDNNSRSALYEYDRHLVSTGVSWSF